MNDAREKPVQEEQTAIDSAFRQGEIKNEIKCIRMLYGLLGKSGTDERELAELTWQHLEANSTFLLEAIRSRLLPPENAANAARLRAARDRLWEYDCLHRERQRARKIAFNIYCIRFLQETLDLPLTDEQELNGLTFEELQRVRDGVEQIARERVARSNAGKETSTIGKTA